MDLPVRILVAEMTLGSPEFARVQRALLEVGARIVVEPVVVPGFVPAVRAEVVAVPTPVIGPPAVRRAWKPKAQAGRPATPEVSMTEGTARFDVFALLKTGPLTSGEVIEKLKQHNPSAIYTALGALRKEGKIETREDEADAQRKNYRIG